MEEKFIHDKELPLLEDWNEDDTLRVDGPADDDGPGVSEVQYKYDVFISYSQCDRPWVRDVLIGILEENGKKVCVDYRDFTPGLPIMDNIVQVIEDSKVTILVLTPSFIASEWCDYGSRLALGVSLETSEARVLPLILMDCELPPILKHLTYLDNTSEDVQPFFTDLLLESLEKAGKWRKVYSGYHAQGIVPVSEIQDVVTRAVNNEKRKEQRRTRRVLRKNEIEYKIDCRKFCCFLPVAVIFAGLCITSIAFIGVTAVSASSLTVEHISQFFNQTGLILGSKLPPGFCKALHLTDRKDNKVIANYFVFTSEKVFEQYLNETVQNFFLLATKSCRKTSYCPLPHSATLVFINVNATDPEYNGDDVTVTCIVEKLHAYLLWGGVLLGSIILFILVTLFVRRIIFPLLKSGFKDELDCLETLLEQ